MRWSAHSQSLSRALKIRKILLGGFDRLGFVLDQNIDDAVGHLHLDRADFLGPEDAEAAAFDHRGAAHPDIRVLGRDHDVATSEQRRVAGEASARVDADQRDQPAQLPQY